MASLLLTEEVELAELLVPVPILLGASADVRVGLRT
jgi:hypothetical protein